VRKTSSNSSLQTSMLRSPPRRPKQSGHALWVGNLPPSTHIIDIKDHFSKIAAEDIESLFLISKSNCAFVNYKTEPGCVAALARFHDSWFQATRLVCRLRRGSTSASTSAPLTALQPSEGVEGNEKSEASDAVERSPQREWSQRNLILKSRKSSLLSRA
jgi:RNA recognition motif-containing protein